MFHKFQFSFTVALLFLFGSIETSPIDDHAFAYMEQIPKEMLIGLLKSAKAEIVLLRELTTNCSSTSISLVKPILEKNFTHVNELIKANPNVMGITDWKPIFKTISAVDSTPDSSLVQFGKTMDFGTNKLMFYLGLRRFFEDKVTENPFAFTELEENIKSDLSDAIRQSGAYGVEWDKLVKAEPQAEDINLLALQRLMNDAFTRIYTDLDLNHFIQELESDENSSESSKILKTLVYGALYHAAFVKYDDMNPVMFKLAFSIKNYLEAVDFEVAGEYLTAHLSRLLNSFHGCIRSIVNEPMENGFLIKSVKYNHFIHMASLKHHWIIRPTGGNISGAANQQNPEEARTFFLKFRGNHFCIRNGFPPETCGDTWDGTYNLPISFESGIKITPSERDNENCYIQNWETGKYVQTGSDYYKQDHPRHLLFSDGAYKDRDSSYLWNFSSL